MADRLYGLKNFRFDSQNKLPFRNFYFKSVIVISEVLGVSYFYLFKHPLKESFSGFYRFLVIGFFISAYVYLIPSFSSWQETSTINTFFLNLEIHLRFVSLMSVIILQLIKNQKINRAFLKCLEFQLPSSSDAFKSDYLFPMINVLINVMAFIILYFFFIFTYRDSYFPTFYFTLLLIYMEYPSLQFSYLISAIGRHLNTINFHLEQLSILKNKLEQKPLVAKDVSFYRGKHLELIELTDYVIDTYSHQVLVCFGDYFFEMIFYLQSSFTNLVLNRNHLHLWDAWVFFCNALLVMFLFLKITQISRRCEKNKEENSRTSSLVNKIINHTSDNQMLHELRAFLVQSARIKMDFSILGIFNLDYKLLYSIICAVSSFGIIIAIHYLAYLKINPT